MHGRKRAEYKALQRDTKVAAKLAGKAVAWHQLQAALLQQRKRLQVQAAADSLADATATASVGFESAHATLQLIEKAVTVNPDPIWLWNFRRELIETLCSIDDNSNNCDAAAELQWERERGVTQTALTGNPKSYAAWHHRKWCLQQHLLLLLKSSSSSTSGETTTITTVSATKLLQQELELTALFFQRDERNFHCWSYRRFVVSCCLWNAQMTTTKVDDAGIAIPSPPTGEWKLRDAADHVWMGAQIVAAAGTAAFVVDTSCAQIASSSPDNHNDDDNNNNRDVVAVAVWQILQTEWDFAELKIRDNFSNFSAFHYRSKLLPVLLTLKQQQRTATTAAADNDTHDNVSQYLQSVIAAEFELVANAVFTEPDDQTAWWYQRFLLDFMKHQQQQQHRDHDQDNDDWYDKSILQPHLEQLRELQQETDSSSKWVLIGVLQCLQYISTNSSTSTTTSSVDERRSILDTLIVIDSDRKERYKHLLRQLDKE